MLQRRQQERFLKPSIRGRQARTLESAATRPDRGSCSECGGWLDGVRIWTYLKPTVSRTSIQSRQTEVAVRQLTTGRWEVRDVDISPGRALVYHATNQVSPFEQHISIECRSPAGARRDHQPKPENTQQWYRRWADAGGRVLSRKPSPEIFLARHTARFAEMSQLTCRRGEESDGCRFPWIVPSVVMIPAPTA